MERIFVALKNNCTDILLLMWESKLWTSRKGKSAQLSHSVVSDSLWPHGQEPARLLCGILQARILKWVAIPFCRGSSPLRGRSQVSCIGGRFFTIWAQSQEQTDWSTNNWISDQNTLALLHGSEKEQKQAGCGEEWKYSKHGESHGQRSLEGYSPPGHKKSDTTEQLALSHALCTNVVLVTTHCEVKVPQLRPTLCDPHGLCGSRNSLGQDTGVGSLFPLQGIFPTQGMNPGLLHCRFILYQLSHKGSP